MNYPSTHSGRDAHCVRWRVLLLSLSLMATAACQGETHAGGQVLRIFDGDSFIMREPDGSEVEVRLYGIDAPERRQPWSRRSRQALVGLLRGHELMEAMLEENVNEEMIRSGHAWVYRRFTDDPTLIRLEERAREAGTGLWGLPEAERIAPWRWRREQRARSADRSPGS